MQTWTRNLVAGVTMFVLCLVLLLYHMKRRYIYLATRLDPVEHPAQLPDDVHYCRVPVRVGNAELAVYYHEPHADKPTVVYCHGTHGCVELDWAVFERARPYVNLVGWDYRGYGRSSGTTSEETNEYDLLYVLAWLQQEMGVAPRDIVLWGRSMGTNVALRFVGHPDRQALLPDRLVLLTPFARLSDVLRSIGFPAPVLAHLVGNMDVTECLRTYCEYAPERRRVLIMGSRHDQITPWENAVELRDVAPDQCTLTDIGGTHLSEFTDWALLVRFILSTAPAKKTTTVGSGGDEQLRGVEHDAEHADASDESRSSATEPSRHSPVCDATERTALADTAVGVCQPKPTGVDECESN